MKYKLLSYLGAASLMLAATAPQADAGHYVNEHAATYVGLKTISWNVPTQLGFNALYSIWDIPINNRPGKTLRVLNLSSTTDSAGNVDRPAHIAIAKSNNIGNFFVGDCSMTNISPMFGSGSGSDVSYYIETWQPNCSWWNDILTHFHNQVPDETNGSHVIYFDGIGNPLAIYDVTSFTAPNLISSGGTTASSTPNTLFGHRVDYTQPLYHATNPTAVNAAIAASWQSLWDI